MFDFTHDGHVHTPFCPHGSKDPIEQYIRQAIAKGLRTITFTEHAPLPDSFVDPTPEQDSAMKLEELPEYFDTLQHMRDIFRDKIEIRIGLEIDYLPGLEEETILLIEPYSSVLDEAILSQHFLYVNDTFMSVDFSAEEFDRLVQQFGSFENTLKEYYQSLEKGLSQPWEKIRIKRIGHLDLPIKYQKNYEWDRSHVEKEETSILNMIAARGFGLDFNTAGLRKPDCGQSYTEAFASKAMSLNIPFTLGSDAHIADDVAADFETIRQKKATFL